jgi:hypothetical protein
MTDNELRGRLLSHFYRLQHNNGGYVPVNSIILSPEPVSDDVIACVCRQLADVGLIEWTAHLQGPIIGLARIRGPGADAVERGGSASLEIQFPEKGVPTTTVAVKEPERINLAEGLAFLAKYLPAADAKVGLRDAFTRKAISQWPCFALSYDEAVIDWTTGSVKIPRKREPFSPTFSRADLKAYFLAPSSAVLGASSERPKAVLPASITTSSGKTDSPSQREILTLKPTLWGMSIDLKELARRAMAWLKATP